MSRSVTAASRVVTREEGRVDVKVGGRREEGRVDVKVGGEEGGGEGRRGGWM